MQELKKETHVRISIENKEGLEEKRRKLCLKSINEVISMLLQKEEEFSIIKKVEKRKKSQMMDDNMQLDDKLNTVKPKTELPSLNGKCLFRAERQDGKIDCAKDFLKSNVIHALTIEQCNECWNNALHIAIEPNITSMVI